jgi:hypothetical protein
MKKLTATICLTLAVFLGSVGMSASADYQKGLTAAKSGNWVTALREWEPLVKEGDADAQTVLGAMYADGKGVPQNYKTAVKWYKLAAEQGNFLAQHEILKIYKSECSNRDFTEETEKFDNCVRKLMN